MRTATADSLYASRLSIHTLFEVKLRECITDCCNCYVLLTLVAPYFARDLGESAIRQTQMSIKTTGRRIAPRH